MSSRTFRLRLRPPRNWRAYLTRRNIILAAVAVVVIAIGFTAAVALGFIGTEPVVEPPTSATAGVSVVGADTESVVGDVSPSQGVVPVKEASDPRFAILLLGFGGEGHEGAYLTDSIMVVIADPTQKTMTLLSVPRDSWVPMMFDGKTAVYNKVNTAFAFAHDPYLYSDRLPRYKGDNGAGNFAVDTISRMLGIPITNFFALDFAGFRQMIDAVGGIDVDVPASFRANYPAADDPTIDDRWIVVSFEKGPEHMTGERAIQFARAREIIDNWSEGSDFARSRRQRLIIEAFKDKLMEPAGILRLPQILGIASKHVETDYNLGDIGQLTQMLLDWKSVTFYQAAITGDNYVTSGTGPLGTYVLAPRTDDLSWSQVRAFARRLWENPPVGVAMANTRIVVINNTGQSGAATRLSAVLEQLGYRVGPPRDGEITAKSKLVDHTGGKVQALVGQLQKDLGITLPVESAGEGTSTDLELYLGSEDIAASNIEVPIDENAPTSAHGVTTAGGWAPYIPSDDEEEPPVRATSTPTKPAIKTATPTKTVVPTPTVTAKPTSTPVRTPTRTATATATPTKPVPTPTKPAPTATKPAPTATKPAPTATKLAPTATKPAPTATKPAPTATKPAPTATKPAPTATKPAPTPTTSTSSTAKTATPTTD